MVVGFSLNVAVGRGAMERRIFLGVSSPTVAMGGGNMAASKLLMLGPDRQNHASTEARGGLVAQETIVGLPTKCTFGVSRHALIPLKFSKLVFLLGVLGMPVYDGHPRNLRQGSMRVYGGSHAACLHR